MDLIIKDSTSECIVLLKSILFKTSLNLTQLFLRLTYSLQEGSVLPPSTKTCLGTTVTWWTSTQSIIPAYLHTVILVGLKLHEVIPTVRYLEKVNPNVGFLPIYYFKILLLNMLSGFSSSSRWKSTDFTSSTLQLDQTN